MERTTGLRFSESLAGYLGQGADFWDAYHSGQASGGFAQFWVTVRIPDLDGFLADPEHAASMTGRLTVAALGRVPVQEGRICLFVRQGRERRLRYALPFAVNGVRYLLRGEKHIRGPRSQLWRQMTTLYAELARLDEGPGEVLSRGVLRIGAGQVLRQALSFRPVGTIIPLSGLRDLVRFLRFCSAEMNAARPDGQDS